jgi:hypothetical protein
MFHEFFQKSPLLALPLFSLVLFMSIFAVVVAYVIRRGSALNERGQLPLAKEIDHE